MTTTTTNPHQKAEDFVLGFLAMHDVDVSSARISRSADEYGNGGYGPHHEAPWTPRTAAFFEPVTTDEALARKLNDALRDNHVNLAAVGGFQRYKVSRLASADRLRLLDAG